MKTAWRIHRAGEMSVRWMGRIKILDVGPNATDDENVTFVHVLHPKGHRHEPVYHEYTGERVFVVRGKLDVVLDQKEKLSLSQGDFLHIPPGTWHEFTAHPSEDVELICLFSPALNWGKPDVILSDRNPVGFNEKAG